jgi:thiol-disulfide isomerase/thioredoxin
MNTRVEPQSTTGRRVALGVGAAALAAIVAVIAFGGSSAGERVATQASGDPAPSVSLAYLDGSQGTLADLTGQPVILNFFADWCPACVAEMPAFEAIHQEYAGDVTFVGLDQSTGDAGLQALLASTGITYDIAFDRQGEIFAAFGGFGMPTSVFLYADGTVARVHTGAMFEEDLRATIDQLFFSS